ncbi:ribosomal RNA processing protein 1 homolog [Topomyia yanbarensis]|uniref:ribosomal RNA processing protein 1 homolog n=1 Tax=Topomyia yanbarensis TaxID=2498891 RepID=UPI00273BC3E6|nr:ribosomal RNA processing protein 1 homolog [Topomyia yanbarensis]
MVVKLDRLYPRAGEISTGLVSHSNLDSPQGHQLKKIEEKSVLVARELKFVRSLAGNDAKLRRKVLKNLRTWLTTRSKSTFAFTETDFLRLWKGLFYCMWMSDKPLIQENLAEEIASLVKCFDDLRISLQYFGAFLEIMCIEWFGIDHWRIDKFMMLVRRCTRQMLILMHEAQWPNQHVKSLMQHIEKTILSTDRCSFGLTKHFNELFLEEIAKVSEGDVNAETIHTIVQTYAIRLLGTNDRRLIKHITSSIFHSLLYQSELGQNYQEKFDLWKKNNFVTGNIDDVDFEVQYEGSENEQENGDNSQNERVYDPRAGQVDVIIQAIKFDPLKIVDIFESNRFKSFVTSKGKKQMKMLVKQYKTFASGLFPLGIQSVESISKNDYDVDIDQQVEELDNYQKKLFGEDAVKKKNKKKVKQIKLNDSVVRKGLKDGAHLKSEATTTKKKKKLSKSQLKDAKLKKLKLRREEKIEAIKEKKSESKQKLDVITSELKVKDSNVPTKSFVKTEQLPTKTEGTFDVKDEWSESIKDGELEFFLPSRKTKLAEIKRQDEKEGWCSSHSKPIMVKNPFATPKSSMKSLKRSFETSAPNDSPGAKKRVKIALNKNVSQDLCQHIQQVKSSPQLPFDSTKKPSKGALKPNLIPSPINPFYRKKIGLNLKKGL